MTIRAEVAEWQTRRSQTPLRATSSGFESRLRHHDWHLRGAAIEGGGMSVTNDLYRVARLSADARALSSGNPRRIARRVGNHVVGRALARAGFWHWLWGGGR
jgi:hypothetical protein